MFNVEQSLPTLRQVNKLSIYIFNILFQAKEYSSFLKAQDLLTY